ncbi:hypothetical protein [Ensifer canadensis]
MFENVFIREKTSLDRVTEGAAGSSKRYGAGRYRTTSTISHLGDLIFAGVVTVEFSVVGDATRLVMTENGVYLDGSDSPLGMRTVGR